MKTRYFFSLLVLIISQMEGRSALITYAGAQLDLGAGWRDSNVAKTMDLDGNNIYGSLGYMMFAVHDQNAPATGQGTAFNNAISSLPSSISISANGANISYTGNYTLINNPTGSGDIWSGISYMNFPPQGAESTLFDVNLSSGVPSSFRLGIFTDNVAPIDASPTALRVFGAGGNSGSITTAHQTQKNDYYFFDVTGANPGDVLTIAGTKSFDAGNGLAIGGLTFEAVPEPSSFALLGVGLAGLIARRKFRANN